MPNASKMSVLSSGNALTLLLLGGSTGVTGMGWGAPQHHGAFQVLHSWQQETSEKGKTQFSSMRVGGRQLWQSRPGAWELQHHPAELPSSWKRFSGTNPDLVLNCHALLCPGEQQGRGAATGDMNLSPESSDNPKILPLPQLWIKAAAGSTQVMSYQQRGGAWTGL